MSARIEDEETEAQRAHLARTRADLARALEDLSCAAHEAARAASRARGAADLDRVYAACAQVRRMEEAVDLAQLDVRTAAGEDA